MTESLSFLVIGYGNSLRRDDGAGLLLAERLAACWQESGMAVRLVLTQQLMPELAVEIAEASISHVVFVDTRVAEDEDSAVEIESIRAESGDQSLGHQMDPTMLLAYANRLYGRSPMACVVTIPGQDFGFGETLSEPVQRSLDQAEAIAADLISRAELADVG